jgi:hypothetical protein
MVRHSLKFFRLLCQTDKLPMTWPWDPKRSLFSPEETVSEMETNG